VAVCGKIRFKLAVYGQKNWFSVFACLVVIIQALALFSLKPDFKTFFQNKGLPISPFSHLPSGEVILHKARLLSFLESTWKDGGRRRVI